MIFDLIAAVAEHPQKDGWMTPAGFATVMSALGLLLVGVLGGRATKNVRIAGDSELTTKEHPPTRREFDKLELDVKSILTTFQTRSDSELKRVLDAVSASSKSADRRITNQNDRLTRKMEEIASGAYQGRQKIWVATNEHAQRLARLEERADIADLFEKLLERIDAQSQLKALPPPMTA